LKGIGVNLNLGPVVDLPEKGAWLKGQTCLGRRAIAEDKATVSQVAEAYCQGMNRVGVWPTLKHFPGLGQVAEETHRQEGFLDTQLAKLSMRDWVPFRQVMEKTRTFLMLGHVRLKCVDAQHMVWASPAVVQGLLRDQWRFNGILITDDLTMGAVRRTGAGIGAVAIQALNAGVDLLLLSYDSRQYYPAMAAVLEALEQGTLDLKRLAQSRHRLAGLWTSSIAAESEKPGNSS
jgi:beta-N-acetylhexosaminidase